MARIRTIKPEFPHSESMGRVTRDARLTFIQMWTLADDAGRLRGNSRMLASLLFPYDDDAPKLIDGWLEQLEREGCIVRYNADGTTCIQIRKWLNHQKIDKPSPSKLPVFDESSRILANPRERSSEDQGSRIKDQGMDQGPCNAREPDTNEEAIHANVLAIRAKYPKAQREDWITAEKLIRKLIGEGVSWSDLSDGVDRYQRLCKATNRMVLNPSRFFGDVDRPWSQEWPLPPTKADTRLAANIDVMQQFIAGGS